LKSYFSRFARFGRSCALRQHHCRNAVQKQNSDLRFVCLQRHDTCELRLKLSGWRESRSVVLQGLEPLRRESFTVARCPFLLLVPYLGAACCPSLRVAFATICDVAVFSPRDSVNHGSRRIGPPAGRGWLLLSLDFAGGGRCLCPISSPVPSWNGVSAFFLLMLGSC